MGLDSFKTEGPRTRKRSEDKRRKEGDVIHIFRGTNPDTSDVPINYSVHKVVVRQELLGFEMPSEGPYFICSICGRVSANFESIAKVDRLKNREKSWAEDVYNDIVEEFKKINVDERIVDIENDDFITEDIQSEDEEEEEEIQTGGLESFKT